MDASVSPHRDLPQSVELLIQKICREKNQPPLTVSARRMLTEIGEHAAVELLYRILSVETVWNFSKFVEHLVKKHYPTQRTSACSACGHVSSPEAPNLRSPSSAHGNVLPQPSLHPSNMQFSLHRENGGNLQSPISSVSPNFTSSSLHRTVPANVSCHLVFDNETLEKMNLNERRQSSNIDEHRGITEPMPSQQLMILSELGYRKLFLVLSYIGRKRLEDVVTVADAGKIFKMKDIPMSGFEANIWNTYGQKFYNEADRCQYFDWDLKKTHLFYCHVSKDGSYYFKGPYLKSSRTHLQRSLGDENVLIVKFPEDGACNTRSIVQDGILVGLWRYRFFVFKDDCKKVKKKKIEEKKAPYSVVGSYFVRFDSISPRASDEHYNLSKKSIGEARRLFMHVHTLSSVEKYMARFSLILSKTVKLEIEIGDVIIERIDDIPLEDENRFIILDEDGKAILHTDGTGFISEDLALKCPKMIFPAKYIADNSFEKCNESLEFEDGTCLRRGSKTQNKDPPLLMQCRLFYNGCAVKGTLLVNKKLQPGTIQIRPSMIKVERDMTLPAEDTFNSLEIVNISCKPGKNSLSKNLIALLSYGGVPLEFFLDLLMSALEETRNVYSNRRAALRVASNNDSLDYGFVAQRMISCGMPLDEPYLHYCLSKLERDEKNKLKEGKLPISESFYLMGTSDPSKTLKNNQVCVILDNGPISGKVLVYRNPGLHFGDIHIMEAVYASELIEVVGNAKYGIFFSTEGGRSAAYEMGTGDFDGDLYWVSRNPELLKYFQASDPWKRSYSTPTVLSKSLEGLTEIELEHKLFQLFLDTHKPSFSMAAASNSWHVYMDEILTMGDNSDPQKHSILKKKLMQLVDIYYDALDAPKSGKKVKLWYVVVALGLLVQLVDIYYDALDAPKSGKKVDVPYELRAKKYPHHMGRAPAFSYHSTSVLGQIYDRVQAFKNEPLPVQEIWKVPYFEAPLEQFSVMWKERYENYLREMSDALSLGDELKNAAANDVIQKYKQLLYEAPEMEESLKSSELIYEEALAIYHLTYDYAKKKQGVEKCGFAWRVAGSALYNLCTWKLASAKEKPISILPSVLRSLLS